ncbi:hypothetical protein [uncultured Sphingomonas sp.]|uniref:hypothetical protein n=1 Tax=uncultured Sphingomonas sp. TaxID=158754 RepID=UPI0025D074B2|nr:hypothetical protein [uncultured Sphingomonas sp.]
MVRSEGRRRFALVAAIAAGLSVALALANLSRAAAERTVLQTAPTRQVIVMDPRPSADRARYATAIVDAPFDAALLNRWIAAMPAGTKRAAGFTLLRRLGFHDTAAQIDIIADSLQRGDDAQVLLRLDALLARQVAPRPLMSILSQMERAPRWQSLVVARLNARPAWRSQYLFDAATLDDAAGRRVRLLTVEGLTDRTDRSRAAAFASRESWKRGDVALADAFWRRGAAMDRGLSDDRFPFDWQTGASVDFEGTQVRRGDLLAFSFRWNGHGTEAFASRHVLGPLTRGASLASVDAKPDVLTRIDVRYRCQGGGWRVALRTAGANQATFRVGEPLACAAGEIAIVPADTAGAGAAAELVIEFTMPRARPDTWRP